jgi:mycoredoxin
MAIDPDARTTVFTTGWCGYCRRLIAGLTAAGISYREIDIEQVPGAADLVAAVNGGNQTVPTVVFADGSTMTNPPTREVVRKLDDLATAGAAGAAGS